MKNDYSKYKTAHRPSLAYLTSKYVPKATVTLTTKKPSYKSMRKNHQ